MVNSIDIKELTLEELDGVVNIYPWFGAARKELCVRLNGMGMCSPAQISAAALYVGSRRIMWEIQRAGHNVDCSDSNMKMPEPPRPKQEQRIFVVGGDYFSQKEYSSVRRSDDNIFSSFATSERPNIYKEEEDGSVDFCTETLARIYLEQGYCDEAKDIYSKLSLRYPEKSVYFAALIDKINKN